MTLAAIAISTVAAFFACVASIRALFKGYIENRILENNEHKLISQIEKNLRTVMRHLNLPWDDK